MASTVPALLLCSLLVLLVAQPAYSSTIRKSKNAIAEQKPHPSSSRTYIVQTNHLAKPSQFVTLERWYASMVATHSPRATMNSSRRLLHTYDTVMHGFAARLTDEEARRMSRIPGVLGVYKPTRTYYTQTTRSPGFIGLHEEFGAWPESEFGDGIIIGFVDTGIWPERASFDDSGLGPVRSTWKGSCVDTEGFNASLCNNKLVGAKVFIAEMDGSRTPRDMLGHGTHVSGTAAGSEARGANLLDFSRGTAWGVAPRARIAMYKACTKIGRCPGWSVAAAIDAAVSDGVEILSLSLGYAPKPLHEDPIAVATFGAQRRGVFVVLSGGNSGPGASSVTNVAPWMTTVGAATTDRVFPATLVLGNGDVLTGQSLYALKAAGTSVVPLVSSPCGGVADLTPEKVMGKVVVCPEDALADVSIISGAVAAGIVTVERIERFRDAVAAQTFTLPGLILGYTAGKMLDAYISSAPYPVASFSFSCDTVTGENRAPMVAGFSSRGPSKIVPEILKPNVVAPGVNILAAWSGEDQPSYPEIDARQEYNIISGTSMACPHVAGVAALIKKRHGEWTPAMVRSAIITTATPLDNARKPILDNGVGMDGRAVAEATPLVAGAGLVLPAPAMNPGLVYDAGTEDCISFLCSLNYTVNQVRRFVPEMTRCTTTLPGGVADLNYPSLVAVFSGGDRVRTLTRTFTKVSLQPKKYTVTVAAPEGVMVTVTPMTLEFKHKNEKKTYTVQFRSEADGNVKPAGTWDFGHISWSLEEQESSGQEPRSLQLAELMAEHPRNEDDRCLSSGLRSPFHHLHFSYKAGIAHLWWRYGPAVS